MKLIEGHWLYLIEDDGGNLKLGFSRNLYERLYDYRDTGERRMFNCPNPDGKFWVLGVRPGTHEEEREFHKSHQSERIGKEWYPLKSRAAALLLLQNWQEPPLKDRVIWWGEGPHYALVHRKTTSDLASLLSRSRLNKRGAVVVLHPCPYCEVKYSARSLRSHVVSCPKRTGRTNRPRPLPYGAFGKCSQSPEQGEKGFHQTGFHCPKCDACICHMHKGAHNRQFHLKGQALAESSRQA